MLLSNQERMTFSTKLNDQLDMEPKIETQVPKMYPLFRVLSTTTMAPEN